MAECEICQAGVTSYWKEISKGLTINYMHIDESKVEFYINDGKDMCLRINLDDIKKVGREKKKFLKGYIGSIDGNLPEKEIQLPEKLADTLATFYKYNTLEVGSISHDFQDLMLSAIKAPPTFSYMILSK